MKSKVKSSNKKNKTAVPASNWKEVDRILAQNLKRNDLDIQTESVPFIKNFIYKLIKEAEETEALPEPPVESVPPTDEKAPSDFTPEGDKQSFDNALEDETPNDKFDVEGLSPEHTAQNIEQIKEFTTKLEDFTAFLNSPKRDSLHKVLANYDRPGSLMRGITRKASDSITRIAGEIAKLNETLNGFINMAPKKQRDLSQIKAV